MRVKFSSTIPDYLRDEITELITEAVRKVNMTGVEIHVKSAGRDYPHFSGYAYNGPPSISRVAKTTKYLITLHIPWRHWPKFPRNWQYPGLKTAPIIKMTCWQDNLFAVAAHEAYHIKQFRTGMSLSEVKADRWALKRLIEDGRHPEVEGVA